jgi:GntP family gluconate:H+ symporter
MTISPISYEELSAPAIPVKISAVGWCLSITPCTVIAASTFPDEAFDLASGFLPAVLLPFMLATMIQASQGSRVVTAAVSSSIIATTTLPSTLDPLAIVLMICGGAFMFSFVTDPFFWLIRRVTGEDLKTVTKMYTLPLIGAGLFIMIFGIIVQAM